MRSNKTRLLNLHLANENEHYILFASQVEVGNNHPLSRNVQDLYTNKRTSRHINAQHTPRSIQTYKSSSECVKEKPD
jgi:hypothetical protein